MFTLPNLPYAYDALNPYIDALTMQIHLTKHHQAYIDNLNKALVLHPELQKLSLKDLLTNISTLPADIQTTVQNNAGGHFNHSLFWEMMTPQSKMVQGQLHAAILKKYNSMQSFQEQFATAAKTRFGSGWAWSVVNGQGELEIYSTANQDAVIMKRDIPILGLDVWEHAYYLQYQNRRPDYITAWWSVVNWEFAEEQYRKALA
jgi:superoxide dismutase, Fe-Mn family